MLGSSRRDLVRNRARLAHPGPRRLDPLPATGPGQQQGEHTMGIHADLIDDDLDGIDPHEMSEHFRAVAALTKQQLSGMLGWAQQGQDRPVYEVAYALLEFRDCLAVR